MNESAQNNDNKSWLEKIAAAITGSSKEKNKLMQTVRESADLDIIDEDTASMVAGVLNVHELRVHDVMISRSQMTTVANDSSLGDIIATAIKSGHSRFPVTGENKDEILGIILAKDLLPFTASNNKSKFTVKDSMRPAVFIPESKRLDSLLQEFKNNRNHMAIVVDEYGGITGLITIEDVLEQIVGDIEDEYDTDHGALIRPSKNNGFLVKALTPLEDFNSYFSCLFECEEVDTIGGLVMQRLGHLPKKGEIVNINGFQFKTLRADKRRIFLLEVTNLGNNNH